MRVASYIDIHYINASSQIINPFGKANTIQLTENETSTAHNRPYRHRVHIL